MIVFILLSIAGSSAQIGNGCYWAVGVSGQRLGCLPDFYIDGGCESDNSEDCNFDGILGGESFGIHCCPSDRNMNFVDITNCTWHHGEK